MDQEQRDKIDAWLTEKWRHGPCPVCRDEDAGWQVGRDLTQTPIIEEPDVFGPGATYPLIPIFCENCGYALFLSAVLAGVVEPGVSEEQIEHPHEQDLDVDDLSHG